MRELDAAIIAQDKYIIQMATQVKKSLRETVELESLNIKIF